MASLARLVLPGIPYQVTQRGNALALAEAKPVVSRRFAA